MSVWQLITCSLNVPHTCFSQLTLATFPVPFELTMSTYSAFISRVALSCSLAATVFVRLWGYLVSSNRLKLTSRIAKDFNMKGGDECMNIRYAVNAFYLPFQLPFLSYTNVDISAPPRQPSAFSFLATICLSVHLIVLVERSKKWGLFVHLKAMPGKQSRALTQFPCSK